MRLLDLRDEDLRALLLRLAEDFRPPAPRRDDFRAPPRLRPEDPDRDRFLLPLERLDFLAAAMGKLRERGFVKRIARFAHNNAARVYRRCNVCRAIVMLLSDSTRLAMSQDPEVAAVATSCTPLFAHARRRLVHRLVG